LLEVGEKQSNHTLQEYHFANENTSMATYVYKIITYFTYHLGITVPLKSPITHSGSFATLSSFQSSGTTFTLEIIDKAV